MQLTPSTDQADAIAKIVEWYGNADGPQEFYLAGVAGVGKSTIATIAIEEIKEKYSIENVPTAAYTGKAASVLRRKGNEDAQTIHSLIYVPQIDEKTGKLTFTISEESPAAEADLIVLDECSMVDTVMANDLRSFKKKILIMGDPGQLPPVGGQGAFTNREPDVFLTKIHRHAEDSPIIELATLVRNGKPLPIGYDKNGVKVLQLTKETQHLIYEQTTQPICGLNRVRWIYNKRIRVRRNFLDTKPMPGERLICCKNERTRGLFNGSIGELQSIVDGDRLDTYCLNMQMDELYNPTPDLQVDPYLFNQHFTEGKSQKIEIERGKKSLSEFDFGYVITCHKAQGSSWPHVTVIDDSQSFKDKRHAWLYTAITRAETGLTVLVR